MASNCSGVTMTSGFLGAGGTFTPLQGCRKMIWSLSAVVKIALTMVRALSTTYGDAPSLCILHTKSRTVPGMISIIRSARNSGRMYLLIT